MLRWHSKRENPYQQTSFPSGRTATAMTSVPCSNVSIQVFLYTSQSFNVPSHEPVVIKQRTRDRELRSSFKKHRMIKSSPDASTDCPPLKSRLDRSEERRVGNECVSK